jgi:hypothetical protein
MSSTYTKEIKESVIDGSLMTLGIFTLAWIGSKLGMSKPTLNLSGENIAKLAVYAAATDAAIDYAKKNKYIPS